MNILNKISEHNSILRKNKTETQTYNLIRRYNTKIRCITRYLLLYEKRRERIQVNMKTSENFHFVGGDAVCSGRNFIF